MDEMVVFVVKSVNSIWQGWNPVFLSVTVMLGSGTETETGQRSLKQQMQQSISDHPCNKCCPMRMKTCPATSFGFSCQGQGSVIYVKRSGWNALRVKFQIAGALNAPAPSYIKWPCYQLWGTLLAHTLRLIKVIKDSQTVNVMPPNIWDTPAFRWNKRWKILPPTNDKRMVAKYLATSNFTCHIRSCD